MSFNRVWNDVSAYQDCSREYGAFLGDNWTPTLVAAFTTIPLVILTIIIELCAHHALCKDKSLSAPVSTDELAADSGAPNHGNANRTSERERDVPGPDLRKRPDEPPADYIHRIVFKNCVRNPEPRLRANRLVLTTFFFVPVCVAFGFRISATQVHYRAICYRVMKIAPPNWPLITVFNILPFVISTMAWLRTLIDCIIARRNKSLSYFWWPPVYPLFTAIFVAVAVGSWVGDFLTKLMSPKRDERDSDIELGHGWNEEERGLMENVDDNTDGKEDDDERTAYSPRSSVETKVRSPA